MSALDLHSSIGRSFHLKGRCIGSALQTIAFSFFVFFTFFSSVNLHAQTDDDYYILSRYALPDTAIALSETSLQGDLRFYQAKAFSGMTFERYENRRLMRVQSFKNGVLDGPSYVWYPGGEPQMAVNYRQGRLMGRFRGWYMHGSVLYDMVISDRGYAGDFIDDDGRRGTETDTETEHEGTDND